MEIKIIPMGTQFASVSQYIANAVKALEVKGIKHRLTSMGTIIEADSTKKLLDIAGHIHAITLDQVSRVVTFIELDERKDKDLTMEGKLSSEKDKLNQSQ